MGRGAKQVPRDTRHFAYRKPLRTTLMRTGALTTVMGVTGL